MAEGSSKGGIPSWQRKENQTTKDATPSSDTSSTQTEQTQEPDASVKALRFLRDESIKDASVEEKVAFLKTKGLDEESIQRAQKILDEEEKQKAPNTKSSNPVPATPQRDAPPIITYPEFLVHSSKPPPLITTQRLLTTAYVASGVAAAFYGLSEYLVKPMTESLTSARHDLARNTQERLEELNTKLAGVVSKDPALHVPALLPQAAEDDRSTDSDPTELFHRDFGTQTSPELETRAKKAESDSSSEASDDKDPIVAQAEKMQHLIAMCTDLTTSHFADEGQSAEEMSTVNRVLNEYLDGLQYPSSTSSYGVYGSVFDTEPSSNGTKKHEDGIGKIKSEIRSIKGIFLSARNFPGAGPGVVNRS